MTAPCLDTSMSPQPLFLPLQCSSSKYTPPTASSCGNVPSIITHTQFCRHAWRDMWTRLPLWVQKTTAALSVASSREGHPGCTGRSVNTILLCALKAERGHFPSRARLPTCCVSQRPGQGLTLLQQQQEQSFASDPGTALPRVMTLNKKWGGCWYPPERVTVRIKELIHIKGFAWCLHIVGAPLMSALLLVAQRAGVEAGAPWLFHCRWMVPPRRAQLGWPLHSPPGLCSGGGRPSYLEVGVDEAGTNLVPELSALQRCHIFKSDPLQPVSAVGMLGLRGLLCPSV